MKKTKHSEAERPASGSTPEPKFQECRCGRAIYMDGVDWKHEHHHSAVILGEGGCTLAWPKYEGSTGSVTGSGTESQANGGSALEEFGVTALAGDCVDSPAGETRNATVPDSESGLSTQYSRGAQCETGAEKATTTSPKSEVERKAALHESDTQDSSPAPEVSPKVPAADLIPKSSTLHTQAQLLREDSASRPPQPCGGSFYDSGHPDQPICDECGQTSHVASPSRLSARPREQECEHKVLDFGSGDYYIFCRDCGRKWVHSRHDSDQPSYEHGVTPQGQRVDALAQSAELRKPMACGHAFQYLAERNTYCAMCEIAWLRRELEQLRAAMTKVHNALGESEHSDDDSVWEAVAEYKRVALERSDLLEEAEAELQQVRRELESLERACKTGDSAWLKPYIEAKEAAELRLQQRWIPVSERLPEPNPNNPNNSVKVLVHYGKGRFDVERIWYKDTDSWSHFTHWQPLPSAPEKSK